MSHQKGVNVESVMLLGAAAGGWGRVGVLRVPYGRVVAWAPLCPKQGYISLIKTHVMCHIMMDMNAPPSWALRPCPIFTLNKDADIVQYSM